MKEKNQDRSTDNHPPVSPFTKPYHMERMYTEQQVGEFFALLDLPAEYRKPGNVSPSLDFLRVLHTHMISTVPYETLVLHYSPERHVRLDPQDLFQKIVGNHRGRGGYCLENNLFFLFILRDLGFQVYPVGTRSRTRLNGAPNGDFQGWYVGARLSLASKWALICELGATLYKLLHFQMDPDGRSTCALVVTGQQSPCCL